MQQQQREDENDLKELKKKLAQMKQLPTPKNKDEMISFLLKRL